MTVESFIYGYLVEEQDHPDGKAIIEENSQGDWAYVVIEGKVKVKKNTPRGTVSIETIKPGGIFGIMELFTKTDKVRKLSYVADGPTKVGLLDGNRLSMEYDNLSPHLQSLLRALAKRLGTMSQKVSLMAASRKSQ
jgi:CRP-like cAMP-binding protein